MITGARQGRLSGLRRMIASSMARDLGAFVIPGLDIARAHGLDIEASGLHIVTSPRHASVLLIIGNIPPSLRDAASVIYAQMLRPRVIFALGSETLSPLPEADVAVGLSQQELNDGVRQLRSVIAECAFSTDVKDFDAPALQIRIEYTCPMHPEIIRDEPGSCPKCGMFLIERVAQAAAGQTASEQSEMSAEMDTPDSSDDDHCHHHKSEDSAGKYTCPMHPEVVQDEPGSCPKCGMDLVLSEGTKEPAHEHHHQHHTHDEPVEYTCPMHPEIIQNEPGSCPKCGMNLEPREVSAEYACPMHPEVVRDEPGSCPKCGMNLVLSEGTKEPAHEHDHHEHKHKAHDEPVEYTCPMHPEVVQDEPGSCPKCGMDLVLSEAATKPMHKHHHHEHKTHEEAIEYTCPMHPEIIQDEPGSCPECGMNLEPREVPAKYTCPMHPEIVQNEPGSCPKCGMDLVLSEGEEEPANEHHEHMAHDDPIEYTCPMHPEIVQGEPGSCPKCGMDLVLREVETKPDHDHAAMDHSSMNHNDMDHDSKDHSAMNHDDAGFMSMIDVTKDLPRSGDGLPMEWIVAPFGPFFPGLPSGLLLTLTLDGDTVAESDIRSLVEYKELLHDSVIDSGSFVEQLSNFEPLSPIAYQLLACRALENAADVEIPIDTARARIGALERERISSHLGWLALFGQQTGFDWLMKRATSLQFKCQHADLENIAVLKPAIEALIKRLQRTPLLKARTANIGLISSDSTLCGPIARATGMSNDARSTDETYTSLGFSAASRDNGDAQARLQLRLDEIIQSILLIEAAGAIEAPSLSHLSDKSGSGEATVETPRGEARLQLTLENGKVVTAQMETPSTRHLQLIKALIDQQELGDALVAVGSLDLSPWEIRQ